MRSLRKTANELATTFSLQQRKARPWNRPTHIFLEVTNRCNLSCVMCGRTHDRRYKSESFVGDMSLEIVRKLADFYTPSTFVTATGLGEPFLNPQILPILRFLKSRGATVSLTTNGAILDEEISRSLVDLKVDRVVCSVDSPQKETFERIRIGARLDVVLQNIERLSRLRSRSPFRKPYLILEFVAMSQNFGDLPEVADLAQQLGFDEVIIQNLFKAFDPGYNAFFQKNKLSALDPQEALSLWEEFLVRVQKYGLKLYSPFSNGGIRNYLREELQEQERPLKSAHGFLGFIDRPLPGSHVDGSFEISGWALGRGGVPELEVCLETANKTTIMPVRFSVVRPDVLPVLPEDFPRESLCGFSVFVDSSSFPAGVATLLLRVREDSNSKPHTLARQQILIHMPADYRMYCSQPWSTLYVTWDGKIRTCCFNEFELGELASRAIDEIWWGSDYADLRTKIVNGVVIPECLDCLAGRSNPNYVRNWRSWLKLPQ